MKFLQLIVLLTSFLTFAASASETGTHINMDSQRCDVVMQMYGSDTTNRTSHPCVAHASRQVVTNGVLFTATAQISVYYKMDDVATSHIPSQIKGVYADPVKYPDSEYTTHFKSCTVTTLDKFDNVIELTTGDYNVTPISQNISNGYFIGEYEMACRGVSFE